MKITFVVLFASFCGIFIIKDNIFEEIKHKIAFMGISFIQIFVI